ncbi:piezo-type mechanosensitive ion channel component 2-like [Centruroides sculpturatus]|uniref:piezo-type mechanosensitive ion channel component 2-like n=1 Tax=Centruroides sculpturatus TaxID=218467 RepID=UPI000C6EB261|nr:piezo-type mechanosensitive ion channel component 2-like [Centruroides sculpturatus]
MVTSILGLSIHVGLYIFIDAIKFWSTESRGINYCNWDGHLYGLIGLNRLDSIEVLQAIRLVGLDFLVFFCSVAVLVTCDKLQDVSAPCEGQEQMDAATLKPTLQRKKRTSEFFLLLGETLVLIFMAGAGILQPSIISSVYFVAFLAICSWIACNLKLGHRYAISKVPLLIYCATHFTIIYIYQFDFAQQLIPHQSLYARLVFSPQRYSYKLLLSFKFCLIIFCLIFCIQFSEILFVQVREEIHKVENAVARGDSQRSTSSLLRRRIHKRDRAASQDDMRQYDEHTLLLENDHTGKSYRTTDNAGQNNSLELDPNGSIIWSSESEMRDGNGVPDETTTVTSGGATSKYNKLFSPFIFFFRLIVKGSYVATLVIMMTWSITYHSWLTFVLLLWSCTLWMIPNSRRACLYSSPALVIYAELLLILQYIYSFDLTEKELPSKVEGVNLAQIGLVKYHALSYQPLAIKILYTIMFWITLHQRIEEGRRNSDRRLSESVVLEPFNISYSTSQPGAPRPEMQRQLSTVTSIITAPNQCLQYLGEVIKKFMTKFWIWIVACMLMVISLGGSNVVIYRIVYMFLFIFFILIFQFSYHIWRRIMYGFWLTVIVYSMIVLILIYTYQFQNVEKYWIEYLHVSKELQYDIGLEKYGSDPWPLFLKLLTPTFFLIITIIQLHYFHKEFLLISNLDFRPVENEDNKTAEIDKLNPQVGEDEATCITIHPDDVTIESTPKSEVPTVVASEQSSPTVKKEITYSNRRKSLIGESSKGELSKRVVIMFKKILKFALYIYELVWRFLEIHMIKIVMFSVVCLSTYDVCAVHFIFVVLAIIALPFRSIHSFISHCCAVWAALLFLSKMIYQLQSMNSSGWYSNCTSMSNTSSEFLKANQPIDNMLWIGFQKTNNLSNYCKGYIGLLFVLTFQAVVKIRQKVSRYQNGEPEPKPGIMFPKIKREHADCGVLECIKFMFNYFFYKFGVEFCFVTIVSCIGVRLDVYAVISAVWLCALFLLRRQTLAKIWCFYVAYLCLSLPFQYMLCVGIPPGFCIDYPWAKSMNPELREWLFLPNFFPPPNSYKILGKSIIFLYIFFYIYSLIIIIYKFQVIGCVFMSRMLKNYCWVVQLFGIACLKKLPETNSNLPKSDKDCQVPVDEAGLLWDGICFGFLLLQKRLFGSYYFQHLVNEIRAQQILASRGAELIHEIQMKEVQEQRMAEKEIMEKIKAKMDRIRAHQKKGKDGEYEEPPTHFQAIRSGDYGMFEDYSDEEIDLDISSKSKAEPDDDETAEVKQRGLNALLSQTIKSNLKYKVDDAKKGSEEVDDVGDSSQLSPIVSVDRSPVSRTVSGSSRHQGSEYSPRDHHDTAVPSTSSFSRHPSVQTKTRQCSVEDHGTVCMESGEKDSYLDDEPIEGKGNILLSQTIKSNLKYKVDDAKKGSEEVDDVGDSSQLSPIVSVDRSPVSRTVSGSSRHQGSEYSPRDHHDTAVPSTSSFSRHPSVQTKTRQCSVEDHGTVCMESGEKDSYLDDEPIEVSIWKLLEIREDTLTTLICLLQLLSQTIKSNLKYKVDDAKKGSEEVDDVGDSSQLSPIVSVDRSPVSRTVSGSSRHQGSEYSPRDHHDTAVPSTSSFSRHPSVQTKTRQCSVEDHGTVCMESGEKDSYLDDEPIEEDFESKLKRWLEFLGAFIESVFISATAKLNSISKDYRFVARQLSFEKKKLKEKFQQDFQLDAENLSNKDAALTSEPISKENNKLEIKIKLQKGSQDLAQSVELLDACDALDKEFEKSHSTYVRFFVACYYAAVSRSEILCYVIIVINQMSSASILSLPLPLMAFLWGTLSVPRPTKTFWITIITYTEALVVVKYLFQFNFFPWNFLTVSGPFWAPRILGIEKNEFYAVFDLLLLLVVFFHRFMLKSLGLWKDSDRSSTDEDDDETPEKTIESEDTLVVALEDKLEKLDDSEIKPLVDEREIDVSLKKNDSIEERKDIACDGSTKKTSFFDGMLRYFDPFKQFFNNLLFPSCRVTVDVYAYMFFCDFINFFIVVFGYWAFGAGINKGVTSYFEENNVPVSFLIMLLAQFGLIVVDRALYLRKHILGKLIFQIFLVFLVHFWMFFILPAVTDK